VGTAGKGSRLHDLVRDTSPDVVILDLSMPGENFEPITAVKSLLNEYPMVRVLILSGSNEPLQIRLLIDAGVMGYVLKSDDFSLVLQEAIRMIHSGKQFFSAAVLNSLFVDQKLNTALTDQEFQVLQLVGQGLQNNRIGEIVGLSEARIRNILTEIYNKLEIHEDGDINMRVAVVNKARDLGLLLRYQNNPK
jgi:DNA-binding NarL/FixJ family response regulator